MSEHHVEAIIPLARTFPRLNAIYTPIRVAYCNVIHHIEYTAPVRPFRGHALPK